MNRPNASSAIRNWERNNSVIDDLKYNDKFS